MSVRDWSEWQNFCPKADLIIYVFSVTFTVLQRALVTGRKRLLRAQTRGLDIGLRNGLTFSRVHLRLPRHGICLREPANLLDFCSRAVVPTDGDGHSGGAMP